MYFENPVPEFLLQERVAGVKKNNQEKEGNSAIPHDGSGKGYRISNGYKLANAIIEKKPVQGMGNLFFPPCTEQKKIRRAHV